MSERIVTSPYLRGESAYGMRSDQCAYCCHPLTRGHQHLAYRQTRDHILPRAFGRMIPGVTNVRPSCYRCNQLRAKLFHCTALLVILLEEGRLRKIDAGTAAIKLGLKRSSSEKLAARKLREAERLKGSWHPPPTPPLGSRGVVNDGG